MFDTALACRRSSTRCNLSSFIQHFLRFFFTNPTISLALSLYETSTLVHSSSGVVSFVIAPPTLRREAPVLTLSRKAQANEDHLLHRMLQERPTRARLKSRRPFSQQAHHLSDLVTKQSWLRTRWKDDWLAAPPSRLHNFIRDPHSVPGLDLPRKQWTTLNRLRTGVGRFSSSMLKWGLKDSSVCECGAPEQTVDHILDVCPQHRPPSGREGIVSLDEDTRAWLASTGLEI